MEEGRMKKSIGIAAIGLFVSVSPGWSSDSASLEKKVEELTRQNQMLLERVVELEKTLVSREHPAKGLAEKPDSREEKESIEQRLQESESSLDGRQEATAGADEHSLLQGINDHVELKGLVEVEAGSSEDFNGNDTNDITLATVEVGLDARISGWSQAHLLLLYEEGEEDDHLVIDEGTITFGKLDTFPASLAVGKMYLPFGSSVSNMISDPLPLTLGEINDSAILAGFQASGFYGSLYAGNGDFDERGKDDQLDVWGAGVGFAHEGEEFSVDVALDWLNNIGDTNGLGDYLEGNTSASELDEYVEGLAAHILLGYGPFDFTAGYVRALDRFKAEELVFAGVGAEPRAWSFEAGMTFDLLDKKTIFSLAFQGTDEAQALSLPEERYGTAIRMFVLENTSIAMEYLHDKDYKVSGGGTGNNADGVTMQVAAEF
jgi:hypothetical protein